MTTHVADDVLGKFARQQHDWFERVRKGSLDPQKVMSTVQELIDGGQFQIWKTIKLGTGLNTANDFRDALKESGYRIGDWGDDILGQFAFTVSYTEREVDLVNISVAELGFKDRATRKDIYDRALEFGLELCPAEVGPQLRLQYPDQSKDEWLRVAMEPIADSDGVLHVFDVNHGGGERWLDGGDGRPGRFWNGGIHWLFLRSK